MAGKGQGGRHRRSHGNTQTQVYRVHETAKGLSLLPDRRRDGIGACGVHANCDPGLYLALINKM